MHVARCEGARTPPTFALCSLRLNTFSYSIVATEKLSATANFKS